MTLSRGNFSTNVIHTDDKNQHIPGLKMSFRACLQPQPGSINTMRQYEGHDW
jgi:hypothetical protein